MHDRKLKDMLRASVLCRNMDEIQSVWRAVEELQEDGILEGTPPRPHAGSRFHAAGGGGSDVEGGFMLVVVM
jgi:hypothetical protein